MATSIDHEDVKPRLGIPTADTAYDTELNTICTAVAAGVDAAVDSAFLTAKAAYVRLAAIDIATGTSWLGMCDRPGYAEAVAAAGVQAAGLDKAGAEALIKAGWANLSPKRIAEVRNLGIPEATAAVADGGSSEGQDDADLTFGVGNSVY